MHCLRGVASATPLCMCGREAAQEQRHIEMHGAVPDPDCPRCQPDCVCGFSPFHRPHRSQDHGRCHCGRARLDGMSYDYDLPCPLCRHDGRGATTPRGAAETGEDRNRGSPADLEHAPPPKGGDIGYESVVGIASSLQASEGAVGFERIGRGFSWAPARLQQEVWSDPPQVIGGSDVWRLHVETRLLADVATTSDQTKALVNQLNRTGNLFAVVAEDGEVRLHSSAALHGNNEWLVPLVTLVAGLQICAAERAVDKMAKLVGGTIAEQAKPGRSQPHPLLGIYDVVAVEGAAVDLRPLQEGIVSAGRWGSDHATWVVSEDSRGVHIEFETAWLDLALKAHPLLGPGLGLDLWLPTPLLLIDAVLDWIGRLNKAEISGIFPAHFLGAWWSDGPSIRFSRFLPAHFLAERPAEQLHLLIVNQILELGVRARRAAEQLTAAETESALANGEAAIDGLDFEAALGVLMRRGTIDSLRAAAGETNEGLELCLRCTKVRSSDLAGRVEYCDCQDRTLVAPDQPRLGLCGLCARQIVNHSPRWGRWGLLSWGVCQPCSSLVRGEYKDQLDDNRERFHRWRREAVRRQLRAAGLSTAEGTVALPVYLLAVGESGISRRGMLAAYFAQPESD